MQPSSKEQMAYDKANPELVNCDNCEGACCRAGLFMAAKHDEARMIRRPVKWLARPKDYAQVTSKSVQMVRQNSEGANFVRKSVVLEIPVHHGLIELAEDCQQLDGQGRCSIYENRPGQCESGLDPGSPECLGYRAVYAARLAGEI